MGDITKGYTFTAGEVVTPAKLHALVESAEIKANAVTTAEILDGAVTSAKLASGLTFATSAVVLAQNKVLVGNASNLGAAVLVDSATMDPAGFGVKALGIAAAQLATDAVTTTKILDKAVTLAKVADISTDRLLGRSTAATGVIEQLTVGTGLALQTGTLNCTLTGVRKSSTVTVALSSGVTGILSTTAHGLGAVPSTAILRLVCTATDAGYAVGQTINASAAFYDGNDYDISCFWNILDATNMIIGRLPTLGGSTQIWVPHATTGTFTGITDSKWSISIAAWI